MGGNASACVKFLIAVRQLLYDKVTCINRYMLDAGLPG